MGNNLLSPAVYLLTSALISWKVEHGGLRHYFRSLCGVVKQITHVVVIHTSGKLQMAILLSELASKKRLP